MKILLGERLEVNTGQERPCPPPKINKHNHDISFFNKKASPSDPECLNNNIAPDVENPESAFTIATPDKTGPAALQLRKTQNQTTLLQHLHSLPRSRKTFKARTT